MNRLETILRSGVIHTKLEHTVQSESSVYSFIYHGEDEQGNESQKVTLLEDGTATAEELAHIVGEMDNWVARHHGSKCFRKTYGYEVSEDDTKHYLYRRKSPRWRMEIEEKRVTAESLATSLRKAAEFLIKRNRYE